LPDKSLNHSNPAYSPSGRKRLDTNLRDDWELVAAAFIRSAAASSILAQIYKKK
jgi:hypothetical protein